MTSTAVVTGAARGIGAATVTGLAAAGWNVVAIDRCADDPRLPYRLGTREELAQVVALARTRRGDDAGITPVVCDATSDAEMAHAIAAAEEAFGGVAR